MSWAEIKHALNNTLGTNGFKSLNELLPPCVITSNGGSPNWKDLIIGKVKKGDIVYTINNNVLLNQTTTLIPFDLIEIEEDGILSVTSVSYTGSFYLWIKRN